MTFFSIYKEFQAYYEWAYCISWLPQTALHAHKRIYLALKAKDSRKAVEAMKHHMLEEEKAWWPLWRKVKPERVCLPYFRAQRAGFPSVLTKEAEFSRPRLGAWHPRMDENPPSPPLSKGGLGGFESYYLTKQE